MTLTDLSSLGSFISGIAVLASLAFLYFQMRQMTEQVRQAERNQRASINQGFGQMNVDLSLHLTQPWLADLHERAFTGRGPFSNVEILQLINLVCALGMSSSVGYVQRKVGLIDELTFQQTLHPTKTMLSAPAYRAIWPMARSAFTREFREYFDEIVRNQPLRGTVDLNEQFNANLQRVLAPQS